MTRTMDPQLRDRINTPVVLIIFNRPDTTWKVLQEIARAKPPKLLVIADGPRPEKPSEAEKCAAARTVIERVDWDCEVMTNYSDFNMGGPRRIPSGLKWVFENVEEAIILEDDCIAHPTFFCFCEELLDYYQDDERIMHISGNNYQFGRNRTEYSYYFSRQPHTWGFATWRRAWRHFDFDMTIWPEFFESGGLKSFYPDPKERRFWEKRLQRTYEKKIPATWDRLWALSCFMQGGFSITPSGNLVSNIGFGPKATHTKDSESRLANVLTEEMCFPLRHPPYMARNVQADAFTHKVFFSPELLKYIKWRIKGAYKLPSLRFR